MSKKLLMVITLSYLLVITPACKQQVQSSLNQNDSQNVNILKADDQKFKQNLGSEIASNYHKHVADAQSRNLIDKITLIFVNPKNDERVEFKPTEGIPALLSGWDKYTKVEGTSGVLFTVDLLKKARNLMTKFTTVDEKSLEAIDYKILKIDGAKNLSHRELRKKASKDLLHFTQYINKTIHTGSQSLRLTSQGDKKTWALIVLSFMLMIGYVCMQNQNYQAVATVGILLFAGSAFALSLFFLYLEIYGEPA